MNPPLLSYSFPPIITELGVRECSVWDDPLMTDMSIACGKNGALPCNLPIEYRSELPSSVSAFAEMFKNAGFEMVKSIWDQSHI
jgi:hypothetical protein